MPLYVKGRDLHGANAFRLENARGERVLTSNMIGGHPVYTSRVNQSNTTNKNHIRVLSNYIANRLRNYSSPNTKRKLQGMMNSVFNKRTSNQKGYQEQYLRDLARYKERVEPLRNLRKFLANYNQPINNITQQINAETAAFTAATERWVRHQDQIKYWRWVKNTVVPEVLRKI
jgi:iron uptake system EfeUOB component EfeO/EfeM